MTQNSESFDKVLDSGDINQLWSMHSSMDILPPSCSRKWMVIVISPQRSMQSHWPSQTTDESRRVKTSGPLRMVCRVGLPATICLFATTIPVICKPIGKLLHTYEFIPTQYTQSTLWCWEHTGLPRLQALTLPTVQTAYMYQWTNASCLVAKYRCTQVPATEKNA